jgi:hypothetical protein
MLKKTPGARIVNGASSAQAQGRVRWDDLPYGQGYSSMPVYFQSKLGIAYTLLKLFAMSPEKGVKTSIYLASNEDVAQVTRGYYEKQKSEK